jgi:ABC-type uncharacterized transport system auxiliary subunit
MRSRLALLACVACTSACFTGHLPPLELYRIALPDSARLATALEQPNVRVGMLPGRIAIAPYDAPGIYGERSIVYRIGDTEYGTYPSREWALPLSTMLGLVTEDVLRRQPITAGGAIFDPPSYRTEPYVWRGIVRQFEEVDRGSAVSAVVALEGRLVRATDDSVLWAGSVRFEQAVPRGTMPAIVDALSAAAADAIGQLAGEARAALLRVPMVPPRD